jgi:hypothetical protein
LIFDEERGIDAKVVHQTFIILGAPGNT